MLLIWINREKTVATERTGWSRQVWAVSPQPELQMKDGNWWILVFSFVSPFFDLCSRLSKAPVPCSDTGLPSLNILLCSTTPTANLACWHYFLPESIATHKPRLPTSLGKPEDNKPSFPHGNTQGSSFGRAMHSLQLARPHLTCFIFFFFFTSSLVWVCSSSFLSPQLKLTCPVS